MKEYKKILKKYKKISKKLYKKEKKLLSKTGLNTGDKVKVLTQENTYGFVIGLSIKKSKIVTKLHKAKVNGEESIQYHDSESLNYDSHLIDIQFLEKVEEN